MESSNIVTTLDSPRYANTTNCVSIVPQSCFSGEKQPFLCSPSTNGQDLPERSLTGSLLVPTVSGNAPPTPPPSPIQRAPYILLSHAELALAETSGLSRSHCMLLARSLRRLQHHIKIVGPDGVSLAYDSATLEKLARMTVAFRVSMAACEDEAKIKREMRPRFIPKTMPSDKPLENGFSSVEQRIQEIVEASVFAPSPVGSSAAKSAFGNPSVLLGREPEVQALIARASIEGAVNVTGIIDGDSAEQLESVDRTNAPTETGHPSWNDEDSEPDSDLFFADNTDDEEERIRYYSDDDQFRPIITLRLSSSRTRVIPVLLRRREEEDGSDLRSRGRSRTRRD